MRRVVVFVLAATLGVTAASCIRKKEWNQPRNDLDLLLSWMTGSFSSQQQAVEDSTFPDIRLEMVPIWPERDDGYWLYVEQAAATSLDQPYRQRVYHLSQMNDSVLLNSVFEIHQPLRFAGQWRNPDAFAILTRDSLDKLDGCTIHLKRTSDTAFEGSTDSRACHNDYRGAVYATSEMRITEHHLLSWDRGFDSVGTQVWGSEKGGYLFVKIRRE